MGSIFQILLNLAQVLDSPAIPIRSMLENPLPWYRIGFHFQLSHQSGLLSGVQSTAAGCFMMCLGNFPYFSCVQHICHHMLPLYPLSQLSQVWHPTAVLIGSSSPLRSQRCSFDGEVPGKKSTRSPGDFFYSKPNLVPKNRPQVLLSCTKLNTEYTKCNFGNFASCTWLCRAAVSLLWVISSPQITESFTIWFINPHKIK